MGWAAHYIEQLKACRSVQFRPRGNSMSGKIESGNQVTIEPITSERAIESGDIVLCRVSGHEYLHLVKAIRGNQYQIANNRGHVNGWVAARSIFGRCVKVEP